MHFMTVEEIRLANLEVLLRDFPKSDLARRMGKHPNYLSQVHTSKPDAKRKVRPIGSDLARNLETATKKERGWMDNIHVRETTGDQAPTEVHSRQVRLLTAVQAGGIEGMTSLDWDGRSDAEYVNAPPSASDSAFALRVHGDSMVSAAGGLSFPAESIIVVDPNIRAMPGYPVVVKLKDAKEVVFKIYEFDGHQYFLKPLNPRYPIVPLPADARIIGVVISVQLETLPFLPR
jgi:SOS-response transcriptional repressor LexA